MSATLTSPSPLFGARPMRRLLQVEIEDILAVKIINGEFLNGDTAVINVGEDSLAVSILKNVGALPAAAFALLPEISEAPAEQ